MTIPIDPGDTGALAKIAENGMAYGMDRGMGAAAIAAYVANAVARAVVPDGFVVVRRDDLRDAVNEFGWREIHFASADDFPATLDRLRAAIGGE